MQNARYRIYLDGRSLSRAAFDKIESVSVHQEMDQTWNATLEMAICTTEAGRWEGEDDALIRPFVRVRIELTVDEGRTWVPLIDGPVVGYDSALSPEPGQSTATARVVDDSIYLWRRDEPTRWTGDTDSDIARNIYRQAQHIADTQIDPTERGTSDRPSSVMQRWTQLETLRYLATRHSFMHAWVAPGERPGQSVGKFALEDQRPSGYPPLVLLGERRNLDSFSASADPQRPARVTSWALDLQDLRVHRATAGHEEVVGAHGETLLPESELAEIMVPPGSGYGVDPAVLAASQAARHAESFDARGTIRSRCYAGILLPYKMIQVSSVNGRLSGNYVIRSVTHTLTRSEYSQEFTLLRRGQSAGAGSPSTARPEVHMP